MIRNPYSRGLEWNTKPLDATKATIDAIPLRPREVELLHVESLACEATWDRFDYRRHSTGGVPPGYNGWICTSIDAGLTLRFLYRGDDGIRALHAIQDNEQHDLPQALAAALTAVEHCHRNTSGKNKQWIPSLVARFCMTLSRSLDQKLAHVKRDEMDRHTKRYIERALRGENRFPTIPSYIERARLCLYAMKILWTPELLATIQHPPEMSTPLGILATAAPVLLGESITLPNNAKYRLPRPYAKLTSEEDQLGAYRCWIEAMLLTQTAIPTQAAAALCGYDSSRLFATLENGTYSMSVPVTDDTDARMMSANNALIAEAKAHQRYLASGQFLLELPESATYWRQAGWKSLVIAAHSGGLWFAPIDEENRRGMIGYWTPEPLTETLEDYAYVSLTMAAIWHDLVTAGETTIIDVSGAPRPQPKPSQQPTTTNGKSTGKHQPILNLPRGQIHITGRRTWSTAEDQEIIEHQSRGATAHARTLPIGWHASEDALDRARQLNVVLAAGQTFVRGHLPSDHTTTIQPRRARARGLATLAAYTPPANT